MNRADQRTFHYIYKITRTDGKYYIGLHSTDNLDDGYFGSGHILWRSIKKHGKDAHSKEIVEFLPTRKELKLREGELVTKELLQDLLCMNLCSGGGGRDLYFMLGETKQKMSEAAKKRDPKTRLHSEETKQKISVSNKKPKDPVTVQRAAQARLANMTPETRVKLGSGNRGKSMSEEQKIKIANSIQIRVTPELRAAAAAKTRASWTPERKAKHAEKMRAFHASRRA